MTPDDPKFRTDKMPPDGSVPVPEPLDDNTEETEERPGPMYNQAEFGFSRGTPEEPVDVGRQLPPETEAIDKKEEDS